MRFLIVKIVQEHASGIWYRIGKIIRENYLINMHKQIEMILLWYSTCELWTTNDCIHVSIIHGFWACAVVKHK